VNCTTTAAVASSQIAAAGRAPKCHREEERDEAAEEFVVHGPQHRIVHVRLAEECEQRTFQHGAEQ
jgi:hypothetical protein